MSIHLNKLYDVLMFQAVIGGPSPNMYKLCVLELQMFHDTSLVLTVSRNRTC